MIPYIENPNNAIKILLEPITKFSKVAGYKFNIQKSVAFLYTDNKVSEREIKNQSHLQLHQEEKIHRNKSNQGGKRSVLRELYDTDERN